MFLISISRKIYTSRLICKMEVRIFAPAPALFPPSACPKPVTASIHKQRRQPKAQGRNIGHQDERDQVGQQKR
jgi:hypothetical protein